MAEFGEESQVTGVFGGVQFDSINEGGVNMQEENPLENTVQENVGTIRNKNLPVTTGFWQKFKDFWLQEIDWNKEIKVVLTPAQQKVEDEINAFLHQEITWAKVHDFLFQEIKFGKKA